MPDPVLVFDLDDTLYPERQFAISGFRAAAAWARAELGIEGLAEEMTRLLDEGHLGELFALALTQRMPGHRPEHLAELRRTYRDHDPVLELFEDAVWALPRFAAASKLGLITDGTHTMQAKKVEALGIAAHFQTIVYTDALGGRGFAKPHPLSFELVERALASAGDRVVYIGDNPAKDFVAPNAKGWTSVMVARVGVRRIHAAATTAQGGAPRHVITSLRELPEVLGL
jgi:putative hydrolase of the HAD superfamily